MQFSSTFGNWLQGVRVLDFTAVLAGPHMGRVLAQAGADVVKVESIPAGDTTRALPYHFTGGQSGYFKQQNLAKRSIALNLATEQGHKVAMDLAKISDIVIENFRPGVVTQLGVDYEAISKVRPDVVYVSISGWGQTGPYSRMTGEVRSTTALSGLTAPDMEGNVPSPERCSFADTNASIHGVAAIGAGLLRAKRTGKGAYIDLSILEALMTTNAYELPERLLAPEDGLTGREARIDGDRARVAAGNFVCGDGGWVYLHAVTPAAWASLVHTLELDTAWRELSMVERRANAEEIYARIRSYFESRDASAAISELNAAGVSAVPIRSVKEVLASPETRSSGLVQDVEDAYAGSVPVPTGLFATTAFGKAPQRPEPLHGQHSREVLSDLLTYPAADIEALFEAGVVTETIPPAEADA